ncbi:uncharacterized protein LOC129598057 [Paramacrobiotus metropolitanus]|uniref:uncharacterized protein LOC129598057 n=1 Tax=Paramacrobiotus metropolitanus TaxID=2943436 RepID=UPI0024461C53|nr:uncharacterized protein LOC129598057 [Paramacrobiotus metropolitanus]
MLAGIFAIALIPVLAAAAAPEAMPLTMELPTVSLSQNVGGRNTTTQTIRHGQSYTIVCTKDTGSASSKGSVRRPARSVQKPKPAAKSNNTAKPCPTTPLPSANPRRVRLEKAEYVQRGCPKIDVTKDVLQACTAASPDLSTCTVRANDPSKTTGCQKRPLTITFSCNEVQSEPIVCGMIVNNMFDK